MVRPQVELSQQEMETPPALQRLWSRRMTITAPLPEEPDLGMLEDLFPSAQNDDEGPAKGAQCPLSTLHVQPDLCDSELSDCESYEEEHQKTKLPVHLDAANLGDIPARYVIPALKPHEFPAVGVYVDPRIVPGFRYRVRPIHDQNIFQATPEHVFNGRAVHLLSIGRGYSRRLTFEADTNTLNNNSNYFWSDSSPDGFAFELEVVSPGDKFTLHDANHVATGTLEILHNSAPQEEISQVVLSDGSVEKTVRLRALCKVEWFENGQSAVVMPIRGLAVAVKPRNGRQNASVTRVMNVTVGSHQRRGFTLSPGINDKWRHTTVLGESIGDVPTRYTITGLEAHELPVIGTYVDARIMPGFLYRVRPAGSKRLLFDGRSLRIISIGPGYGKRITFAPDEKSLNASNNFLWSDSHPDGLGFEPRAVHAGMKFAVTAGGQRLGEGSVFRADAVQQEEKQELVRDSQGTTVIKYIHIDVTCHITMDTTNEMRKPEPQVLRVSGTAVVSRRQAQAAAQLVRIENIGLSSQLNLLFVTQQAKLVFHPL
ncbi:hypothetical protein B7P43_G11621 [Cryptotermes secundus]|uniref:Uncharacterized protein n=1 Tax=Cryptotermes secundus TaxID=105785 RepID=A0A2J7RBS3_9NEOP|nr:uncharacterized protein LOC111862133 [Cryptotermes secundus]PNF38294.1 hypothetical protein B7P43_G11621 [Cryptotermes secundus]